MSQKNLSVKPRRKKHISRAVRRKSGRSQKISPENTKDPLHKQVKSIDDTTMKNHCQPPSKIFSERVDAANILQHVMECYSSVKTITQMRELSAEQRQKLNFMLPTPNHCRKTLFLDLDETLVHTSTVPGTVLPNRLVVDCMGTNQEISFNTRPYCFEFLRRISELYEIYIFTASHQAYAAALMNYFNQPHVSITGYLSRNHCLRTVAGRYIKDIGLITNRDISQMVLVDNLAYSFGEWIDNGIPILEFTENMEDEELKHLESYLIELSAVDDVRKHNSMRFQLKHITKINPQELVQS